MSAVDADPSSTEESGRAAARNSAAILLGRLLVAALGWAGSVLIARKLSPEDWGQFAFVFGLLGLLSVVTDLGVGRVVLARLMDSKPDEVSRLASSFIALRMTLGVIGYLVALAYVTAMGYPGSVIRATALAGLVVVIATPSHALSVLFQSTLRLTLVAVAEVAAQLVQLGLTIAAALFAPVLLVFVLPAVINELVSLGIKIAGVRRGHGGPRPSRGRHLGLWRSMLIEAVPLTIGTALVTVLTKLDVLILSRLDTFESVGLYSVGYKFSDVLVVVGMAVTMPVTTLLVRAWPEDPETFRRRVRVASLTLGLLAGVAIASFWASAGPVLTLLYGERFGAAAPTARLLVAGGSIAMLSQLGFMVLVSAGRQRVYPWLGLAGLVVNVGLNLLLIPAMSYYGAAIATIATEGLLTVLVWVVVVKSIPVRRLVPGRQLCGLMLLTVAVSAASELLAHWVAWPAVALVCVCVLPLAAHLLRLTGELNLPGLLRGRRS